MQICPIKNLLENEDFKTLKLAKCRRYYIITQYSYIVYITQHKLQVV